LLLYGDELKNEIEKAKGLTQIKMGSRETSDLIMLGIGAFTPLEGFMGYADWKGVCDEMKMANGIFWPIPITLSTTKGQADSLSIGEEVALIDEETSELMGSMKVMEKYTIDKEHECQQVFRTTAQAHPGVHKVMSQKEVNIAGPVKVFNELHYPAEYGVKYMRPAQTRAIFQEKGWNTVAALQLRNPMHRAHEHLAKIAVEICDGLLIHQLVGKLKEGDIPAKTRVKAIDVLVENYFVKDTCIQGVYPMEMRYAGPREALLHGVFRQNYGCSHLLIGRDHAGVGDYYGPYDAQRIFDEVPQEGLLISPLKINLTFYCTKCDGMASTKTCPHDVSFRVNLSGTMLRKMLSEDQVIPDHFSRPEVLEVLKEYYATLDEKVEIKLHKHVFGEK
ncbi:sulfate adenylyltransferase, partial [Candidatus Desantisbacteria bacterium CG_4_9_14_3_um_filter_40_11]